MNTKANDTEAAWTSKCQVTGQRLSGIPAPIPCRRYECGCGVCTTHTMHGAIPLDISRLRIGSMFSQA